MTAEKIAKRIKKNVPAIWETYPYATGVVFLAGALVALVGVWLFGG